MVIGMPRTMPDCPGDINVKDLNHHPGMVTRTYDIEVITPMFGGGVEPKRIDPEIPIRPSSIRGHLRFWWRKTKGFGLNVDALRSREEEIWGSSKNPSPVIIDVDQQPIIDPCTDVKTTRDLHIQQSTPAGYALFSAEKDPCLLYNPKKAENLKFTLKIIWPDLTKLQNIRNLENKELIRSGQLPKSDKIEDISDDVIMALRAWVNFGGIGARTRRGCGALYCQELAPKDKNELKGFHFRIFLHDSEEYGEATLPWEGAIKPYQNFRQDQRPGLTRKLKYDKHSPSGVRPIMARGRSYWPEPDSIRKITEYSLKKPNLNSRDHSKPKTPIAFFPRAEFGLPIVFHFSEGPKDNPDPYPDPYDTALIPVAADGQNGTRMASPVITRPLLFADGKTFSAMIVVLPVPVLKKVRLIDSDKKCLEDLDSRQIVNKYLTGYEKSPMKGRTENGSAIEAFITFVQEEPQSFNEVQ
jgi:CRISPR-associated protein Cmr1